MRSNEEVDGRPIDLITLVEKLNKKGELKQAGGAAYVVSLMDAVGAEK